MPCYQVGKCSGCGPEQCRTAVLTTGVYGNCPGGALAGASVVVSGPQSASGTTDAAGNYTATGLTPGTYTVVATSSGKTGSKTVVIDDECTNISIIIILDISSTTKPVVSGNVSGGYLGDWTQDVDFACPLAGATITATATDGSGASASGTSDASGNFSVALPKQGQYTVTIAKAGYQTFTTTISSSCGATTFLFNKVLRSSTEKYIVDGTILSPPDTLTLTIPDATCAELTWFRGLAGTSVTLTRTPNTLKYASDCVASGDGQYPYYSFSAQIGSTCAGGGNSFSGSYNSGGFSSVPVRVGYARFNDSLGEKCAGTVGNGTEETDTCYPKTASGTLDPVNFTFSDGTGSGTVTA